LAVAEVGSWPAGTGFGSKRTKVHSPALMPTFMLA
jgi:hypothetical protein